MPLKLHLKRTPQDEASPESLKRKKKERKAKRKHNFDQADSSSHKHPRTDEDTSRRWASSDDEPAAEYDHQPGSSSMKHSEHYPSVKPDYDQIRAEIEDQRFRERMFEALEDDERLDSLEARLNDYAHVPDRWGLPASRKPGNYNVDDFLTMDPSTMDEEEYAEWIRVGMYRYVQPLSKITTAA